MAKIKISEVGIAPRTPNTPNVEGATIPLGIATQFGKAVGSLGKVIEDIALRIKLKKMLTKLQILLQVSIKRLQRQKLNIKIVQKLQMFLILAMI